MCFDSAAQGGSSPLARGTPKEGRNNHAHHRLIPARAGNTASSGTSWLTGTAHPRSRGEHLRISLKVPSRTGSSPLARGTQFPISTCRNPLRLIPARAGNTRLASLRDCEWEAHPRSRGEHTSRGNLERPHDGSSPLARGTPWPFIAQDWVPEAHPRSRGEHGQRTTRSFHLSGSSPLARGTRRPARLTSTGFRLIPARAGNTLVSPHG